MTAFDALAAAIRERLISGRPAPLPGLGTLVRQHVSARIEERPDGTRVLLPPGETIGLAPTEASHESLATSFGRLQALPEAEADGAYARAMDQLEARLAAMGEVRLPGVGLLRRTSGGVVLGVEAELLSAVNRAFEGLTPVGADPAAERPPVEPDTPSEEEATIAEPESSSDPIADAPEEEAPVEADPESALGVSPFEAQSSEADEAPAVADASGFFATPPTPEPTPASDLEAEAADDSSSEAPASEATEVEEPDVEAEPPPLPEAADEEPDADEATPEVEDEAMAVPFGAPEDDVSTNAFPPTPPEADPSLNVHEDPPAETSLADEDWASETWTAGAGASASGLLGAERNDLIEDADFEVLPPNDGPPPIETVSPDAELEALFASAPEADVDVTAPPVEPPPPETADVPPPVTALTPDPTPSEDETATPSRGLGWLVGLLLLALLVAAAVWWWSSTQSDPGDAVPQEPVLESVASEATTDPETGSSDSVASPAAAVTGAPASGASPSGGSSSGSSSAGTPSGDGAPAAAPPTEAATASAPSRAASGTAVSPPRLDGLDEGDRRALAGGPIDPAMGGWTIVVASLRSESAAEAESALYREAGYRTGVFAPTERGQTRHRVGVGQFGSEAHAHRLMDRLPPRAPADAWLLNLRSL